uniref:Uncharacterized protein n=1 Tax=viral metagenome TaxID=1070528 RepID=A0A6C0IW75_9ZZZZ
MHYDKNTEKIIYIINTLNLLDVKVESMEKKIDEINQLFMKYEFNKNLKLSQSNSYLKFQINILVNEKKYYIKVKSLIVRKIFKELYEIYNYSILLLISLDNLDYGFLTEKNNIMQKIIKIKKDKNLDYNKLSEITKIINTNLYLVKNLLDLFEKFIIESSKKNMKKKLHTKNLKINLMNNKNHINLEYIKYNEQLELLLDYFYNFSIKIEKQFKNQGILSVYMNFENT